MLMIRLQRTGKRNQAHFRVIIAEHTKKPKGEYLELLGRYNPHQKVFEVSRERVEYWMSKGAQISPTVNNLMVNYKVWDRPKMESWKPKQKENAESPSGASSNAPAEEKKEAPKETKEPESAPAEA